eukprot:m.222556 g.222556  ORF g.222556 m.222556 type:complete len:399 (+) comp17254_c0_seq13:136-1332(+)
MSMRRSSRERQPSRQLVEAAAHGIDEFFLAEDMALAVTPSPKKRKSSRRSDVARTICPTPLSLDTATTPEMIACDICAIMSAGNDIQYCPCCQRSMHMYCGFKRRRSLRGQSSSEMPAPFSTFCLKCEPVNLQNKLTPFRTHGGLKLTQGGKLLLSAIHSMYTPTIALGDGTLRNAFGCNGFELRRGFVPQSICRQLVKAISTNIKKFDGKQSMLTPSITDRSRKVYCCTEAQRQMRGGRYASCPLKPSNTLDLLKAHFPDGRSLNQAIETEFPSTDPFVTQTQLLCQQVAWHYEDLELHCDRERPDKLHTKQDPAFDGIGDRITSLTLRTPCWLLLRERANHKNYFAVWLEPGDVYTMAGDSRWKWQHGIFLPFQPDPKQNNCRISIVFRLLEHYPE